MAIAVHMRTFEFTHRFEAEWKPSGVNPVTGKFGVVVTAPPNSGKDIIVSFCCRKRMTEREEVRKAFKRSADAA